jgi:FAD/FMN-containing dehydrogenase
MHELRFRLVEDGQLLPQQMPDQSHFMPRPVAVLMPGSTEEIQAIVKTCNRYKVKVKPCSTGWYFFGPPRKMETTPSSWI